MLALIVATASDSDYRVSSEDGSRTLDPWRQILLCKYGHIFVHGRDVLGIATNKRGKIAKRLAALGCTQLVADADDGCNFIFPADAIDQIFRIVLPRRRRHLSAEHKAKLLALVPSTDLPPLLRAILATVDAMPTIRAVKMPLSARTPRLHPARPQPALLRLAECGG
jgi:hypothetical protein